MAVNFSFSPSASNKSIKIPLQLIADGNGTKWKILVPKIDKLSFTYDMHPSDHKMVKEQLWDLSKEGEPFSPAKPSKTTRYRTRVHLTHPATGHSILIEVDPKPSKKHIPFIRLDLNPAKLGPKGVEFLKDRLVEVFLGNLSWKAIATGCKVTRIDLALDVLNVPIDQLLIRSNKSGKSHCYYSASGVLETAYLEVKKGKAGTTTVYNKGQQLIDKERNPKFAGVAHTRIEVHVKTARPIVKLGTLPNPFSKLQVGYPAMAGTPPEQLHHWQHFLDSVRYRGEAAALSVIEDLALRETYASALAVAQETFWNPVKLWEKWPEVLSTSGLLP